MRLRLVFASTLLSACFAESVDDSGDTDSMVVPGCRECQRRQCAAAEAACAADPECDACVAAPFGLACLSNPNMHRLGSCSCEECGNECDYQCPGAPGSCNSCGIDACPDLASACIADGNCAPCFEDPYAEGCADNPQFMAAQECQCLECGQNCVWECPQAGNTCAACLTTECASLLGDCMGDEACAECFASPYLSMCTENMRHQSLLVCICGSCSQDCGVLFDCGG
jgi:hypothetical protein